MGCEGVEGKTTVRIRLLDGAHRTVTRSNVVSE